VINLEDLAEQVAQRVAERVVELLPSDAEEWAQVMAEQAHRDQDRVAEIVALAQRVRPHRDDPFREEPPDDDDPDLAAGTMDPAARHQPDHPLGGPASSPRTPQR
jgi:hypothetical protein